LNFTSIYAQNSRGKNSPNTAEVNKIAGEKYNSYWGWQDGEKRNSRDKDVEEPIFMLSHYWKITDKTNLNTNVSYQFGKIGNSRLDFQNVNNPDPTYYRNLPSYYTSMYDGNTFVGDSEANVLEASRARFLTNRQIDWRAMYAANGRTAAGNSVYALYEDRTDDKTWTANSILNTQLSDNIILNAGATYRKLKSHNFQNMLDLLGGQYFNDIDNFYTGDFAQSDLNNPNRQVGVGDTYGYNYNLLADVADAFAQFKFNYNTFDFYLAQSFSRSQYQREGLYKNGLYASNSFGKSDKIIFENFGFKGGFTYKMTGRQMFDVNAIYMTKAPSLRNTFPNARLNNIIVPDIDSENIMSVDASYIIRAPKLKARLTGFYSTIKNATETSFFFAEGVFEGDGSDANAFVAETVTNINKKNMGVELGIEYQIIPTLKFTATGTYGQYTYDNNPTVSINNDALAALVQEGSVASVGAPNTQVNFGQANLKNYRLPLS
jgi:hypothetical protein